MNDGIIIPFWLFYILVLMSGLATFICGIYLGYLLRLAFVFVQGFFRSR